MSTQINKILLSLSVGALVLFTPKYVIGRCRVFISPFIFHRLPKIDKKKLSRVETTSFYACARLRLAIWSSRYFFFSRSFMAL